MTLSKYTFSLKTTSTWLVADLKPRKTEIRISSTDRISSILPRPQEDYRPQIVFSNILATP